MELKDFKKQEYVVLLTALVIAGIFAVVIPQSMAAENLVLLFKNISIVAICAIGMAIVVLGRGIDLSLVSTTAVASAWVVSMVNSGTSMPVALLCGLAFVVVVGAINGTIIAYLEVPPVIATLASGMVILGFGRYYLLDRSMVQVGSDASFLNLLGKGYWAGIPVSVIVFLVLLLAFFLVSKRTAYGRYIYAVGDNVETSRITGLSVRPLIVSQYALCSVIGYVGGLVMAGSVGSVNLNVANGTLIFDVLTVVIVGGISLIGGRGGTLSLIAGVTLIGLLINGLIILNVSSDVQAVIRGAVLLAAVVVDSALNPRDEETARQGEL